MNYATTVLAMVKAPHSVFDSSVKIHRLVRISVEIGWTGVESSVEFETGCSGGNWCGTSGGNF